MTNVSFCNVNLTTSNLFVRFGRLFPPVVYPELVEGLRICHSEALEESAQVGAQIQHRITIRYKNTRLSFRRNLNCLDSYGMTNRK